jgi:hypothetical protein
MVKLATRPRTADEPLGNERPVKQWACDADDWTARRTHIRAHMIIDNASTVHVATTVLRRTYTDGLA